MKKRITTLISLLILFSLSLAACAGGTTPTAEPATQAPAEAPTQAPVEPEPTEAAPTEPEATPETEPVETEAPEETAPPEETEPAVAGAADVTPTLRLPDLQGRTVVAVTANDYVPLNYVDPLTGEAVGWEYDAVDEICRRLNCTVDWQVTAWDTMITAVREGQFDVGMDGITITEERAQQVDFSDPYLVSEQFMLVRADEDRFSTPEEFAADENLLIGTVAGTTNFFVAVYDVLDGDEANPRIQVFDNFGAAVQALLSGDVDMVLMDVASSRGYIGANPEQLKIVGDALASEEFGFIFTPDSDLVEPFNAAIATMAEDGFFDHLNTRWFFLYDPTAQ